MTTVSYPVLRILASVAMVSIVVHYTTSRILQMFHHRGQEEAIVAAGAGNGSYYLRRGGGITFLPTTETANPNARHLLPASSSSVLSVTEDNESVDDDLFYKEEDKEYDVLTDRQRRRHLVPIEAEGMTTDPQPHVVPLPPPPSETPTTCKCTCILAEGGEEGWAIVSFDDELVEGVLGGDPSLCIPKHELRSLVEAGKGVCDDLCTIN